MTTSMQDLMDQLTERLGPNWLDPEQSEDKWGAQPKPILCPRCNLDLSKATGFVCQDTKCPTQTRFTCK